MYGYYLRPVTIQGQRLIKEIRYKRQFHLQTFSYVDVHGLEMRLEGRSISASSSSVCHLFYALFRNVSFEGPFWQLGAYGECGASSPCFTDCLQELPVTMTNSCPGNSGVEVKCSKFGCRIQKFKFGSLMCGSPI